MAYCVRLGIPHSRFLSWDPDDQDKALAYLREMAKVCNGCGTRPEEWDPEQGGNRTAYVADTYRCTGCEVREQEQRNLEQSDMNQQGVRVILVPNKDRK